MEDINKRIEGQKAQNSNYSDSTVSDGELPIGFDNDMNPKEVIFAELPEGCYFGELSLPAPGHDAKRRKLRGERHGLCFTSVWATTNCHTFYIESDDFIEVTAKIQQRTEDENMKYLR